MRLPNYADLAALCQPFGTLVNVPAGTQRQLVLADPKRILVWFQHTTAAVLRVSPFSDTVALYGRSLLQNDPMTLTVLHDFSCPQLDWYCFNPSAGAVDVTVFGLTLTSEVYRPTEG